MDIVVKLFAPFLYKFVQIRALEHFSDKFYNGLKYENFLFHFPSFLVGIREIKCSYWLKNGIGSCFVTQGIVSEFTFYNIKRI